MSREATPRRAGRQAGATTGAARHRALTALVGSLVVAAPLACTRERAAAEPPPRADVRGTTDRGRPLAFAYESVNKRPFTSEALRGRLTVIGFVATYDFASQAEARALASVLRRHTPRVNVALLVLEQPENEPLVEAFATTLGLPYPVALADAATIAGQGPFAGLHHVPSVVVLDKLGREAWRHVGFADEQAIDQALRRVEASGE
ncbi:MAG TPA: TlpA disulfide reductase family protein [Minicystis sp.]|nr:TlpA disulfide reductase family protein [Minicystis sp.]